MYELAKKARSGMKSKAQRLAGEKDRKTDSSDWSPAPELNADVKTGMRPVSRRAYKKGGKVDGMAAKARADRKPRKAGGKVEAKGEQPLVDRYINRDLKKANEYRDGKKHVGALKHGGRAKLQQGGKPPVNWEQAEENYRPTKRDPNYKPADLSEGSEQITKMINDQRSRQEAQRKHGGRTKHAKGGAAKHSDIKEDKALIKKMIKESEAKERRHGGRLKKEDGGPAQVDPRLSIVKPKMLEFAQNVVTPGLKKGGRVKKEVGGPAKVAGTAATQALSAPPVNISPPSATNIPPVSSGLMPQPAGDYRKPPSYAPYKYEPGTPGYREYQKMKKENLQEKFRDRTGDDLKSGRLRDIRRDIFGGLKKGGRIAKADGGKTGKSFWGSKEFQSAFRQARNAYLAGEGPKTFEFKGKTYGTDLMKVPTPPQRPKAVQEKVLSVEFGPPKGQMPKTDEMGNPNPGMKKGGRIKKQIGGALGRAVGALGRGMGAAAPGAAMGAMGARPVQQPPVGTNPAVLGRGPAPQAMANAQGVPFQPGGKFATQPAPMQPQPMPMPNPIVGNTGQLRQQRPPEMTTMPLNPVPAPINYIDMGEYLGGTQNMTPQPYAAPLPSMTDFNQQLAGRTPITSGPLPSGQSQPGLTATGTTLADLGGTSTTQLGMPPAYATGGRIARAYGGETGHKSKSKSKSGKTNINIVIATGKSGQQDMGQQPPMGAMPPPPPPPAPPMGGPMAGPMGAPPMPPPAMGGGMPPMPPDMMGGAPMPRKAGGRVTKVAKSYKDMTAGAGSGEGRLQKTDIAKRAPHKAGGKVYRSYKDMDAGAGSGEGRLEKTQIQKRKK